MRRLIALTMAFIYVTSAMPITISAESVEAENILISAVKNDGQGVSEYVNIYNPRTGVVDISGWEIEYSKDTTALDFQTCSNEVWQSTTPSNTKTVTVPVNILLEPLSSVAISVSGMLDDKQGSVRLLETSIVENAETSKVHDVVGWGSDSLTARCAEKSPADIPGNGEIITRCLSNGILVDSNNNSVDFTVVAAAGYVIPECPIEIEPPDTSNCNTVSITEILPSVEGSDTGKEFIELFNPTSSSIDLFGCGVAVAGSSQEFMFPENTFIPPNAYKAFYDSVTGISLPNSSETELLVISATEEFVQTSYPSMIKEDYAWAKFDNEWKQTNVPSPGAANIPSVVEVVQNQSEGLGPCPAGKFRNPATNRCKSLVAAVSSLTPCKLGQERNPATNRCRSLVTSASSLTPCKPGQERNPETNRCRKMETGNSLKPCAADEERNPETNRCRKVNATLASASVEDKQAEEAGSVANYALLGLIGASVAGYGAFEYRGDLRNKIIDLKSRFFTSGK